VCLQFIYKKADEKEKRGGVKKRGSSRQKSNPDFHPLSMYILGRLGNLI
jgi:hypothetical protein